MGKHVFTVFLPPSFRSLLPSDSALAAAVIHQDDLQLQVLVIALLLADLATSSLYVEYSEPSSDEQQIYPLFLVFCGNFGD